MRPLPRRREPAKGFRLIRLISGLTLVALLSVGSAQAANVFVYPKNGQSKQQQSQDQAACQKWAKENSGVDPAAASAKPPPGSNARGTVGGAARGAALGAGVGAIAGDAGKGAGAGAVVGGVAGRRNSKRNQQAAQANAQDQYQRAFAACMDARGYSVK
jgi:hypothetical protein